MNRSDRAKAMGEAARVQLMAACASASLWHIRDGAEDAIAAHIKGPLLAFWDDDDDDWDDDDEEEPAPGYEVTDEGIAIVKIHGPLIDSEPTWWMNWLGYASLPGIARAITTADLHDINVVKIYLDIKSPGGMVSGLAAACDAVWAVRQRGEKDIQAACKMACSAAYEIASQCRRMYLAKDGDGGCLGTLMVLSDWSGYYEQMGVKKYRITSTGAEDYKGAGSFGTELTPAQRADFKRQTDEARSLFNEVLMRGRGWDAKRVVALTDGRVHFGRFAFDLGLFDGIADPEEVLRAMGSDEELEGEPAPAPPTDDEGEPLENTAAIPNQSGSMKGKRPMKTPTWNDFTAWFKQQQSSENGSGDGAPTTTTPPANPSGAAEHPLITACRAHGIETPEQLTALRTERDNLRGENEKMSALREECMSDLAAQYAKQFNRAHGPGRMNAERARKIIDSCATLSDIRDEIAAFKKDGDAVNAPDPETQRTAGRETERPTDAAAALDVATPDAPQTEAERVAAAEERVSALIAKQNEERAARSNPLSVAKNGAK